VAAWFLRASNAYFRNLALILIPRKPGSASVRKPAAPTLGDRNLGHRNLGRRNRVLPAGPSAQPVLQSEPRCRHVERRNQRQCQRPSEIAAIAPERRHEAPQASANALNPHRRCTMGEQRFTVAPPQESEAGHVARRSGAE